MDIETVYIVLGCLIVCSVAASAFLCCVFLGAKKDDQGGRHGR